MKRTSIIVLMALFSLMSFAQSLEYTGVKRLSARSLGEIYNNDELKGYYTFFYLEKADKKNSVYHIELADNNLNKTASFDITRDKNSILLEVTFNGEYFMLTFFAKKKLEYVIYDTKGKVNGTYTIEKISRMDQSRIALALQNPEQESITTYSLGSKGFLKLTSVNSDNWGYEFEALDNNAKSLWKFGSKANSEMHEFADVMNVSNGYAAIMVGKKKSLMTKKIDFSLVVLDLNSGDVVYEDDLTEKGGQLTLLNCFFDKDRNSIVMIGQMYKAEDEPLKDQSVGLYLKEVKTDGTIMSMNKYLWDKEIAKVKNKSMTAEEKESEERSVLYVHRAFRSKDGVLTLVAEQYRKQVSALGVAGKVLSAKTGGNTASAFEIAVMNIVVIQFNSDMSVKSYEIVPKRKTRVSLPNGYGIYPPALLAAYIKNIGGFDYSYTSTDKANDKTTVLYRDYNRKEEGSKEKNDVMLGAINFKGSEMTKTRTPINSDASRLYIQGAKPGYVVITEYYGKAKKLTSRLEPVK